VGLVSFEEPLEEGIMPERRKAKTRRRSVLSNFHKAILAQQTQEGLKQDATTEKDIPSTGCPYSIPAMPFPWHSKQWESIPKAAGYEFFQYEAWLRSPAVWTYARTRQAPNKNQVIGGIPLHRLQWLLIGGHHEILTAEVEVRDIAGWLTRYGDNFRTERGRQILKDKLEIIAQQIIETAECLWNGDPTEDLYLRIKATGDLHAILEQVKTMVEARKYQLKISPLFSSELEAQELAVPKRAHPPDWSVWARRFLVWDMRQNRPPLTFPQIGKKLFRDAPEPEKAAETAYREAILTIKAAEAGSSRPKFKKTSSIPSP
jgi:hypothetical protein